MKQWKLTKNLDLFKVTIKNQISQNKKLKKRKGKIMKQQTVEKILILVCVAGIILLAKHFVNKQMHLDEQRKAHVDSLEMVALKVDSLEKVISFFEIQHPDWELEINANCKDFAKDFEKGFSKDSLVKVVIVGTTNGDGSLKWLIRTRQN